MVNIPITMSELKATLRFYTKGKSKPFISKYLGLSRNIVLKYIQAYLRLSLTYEDLEQLGDRPLYGLFQMSSKKE